MQDYVIGVDVGGTNIRMGAVDYLPKILTTRKIPTQSHLGANSILDRMEATIREVTASLPDLKLKAIGLGIPGAVRSRDGVITQAPNIKCWEGLAIASIVQQRVGVPAFIENDANSITVGEMWVGAGRGANHVCCLTLGTGVGGGVIVEGELLRGADGMAGELGHISVKSDGPRCNCGSYGCLEMYSSATGILTRLKKLLAENRETTLASLDPKKITPAIVYQHAEQGDAVASELLEFAAEGLGIGMASLINIFNPEVFIIGGGVAGAWERMKATTIRVMKSRAFHAPAERVKIVRAEKEDDAGIFGAAYIAFDWVQRGTAPPSREKCLTPWGFWEVLEEGKDYKVKRLYIHPGHRLSYQRHQRREESWMIARGEADVVLDGKEIRLRAGDTCRIATEMAHRIGNPGEEPLVFFEVQRGSYFGEDDIQRLSDDYKR